MDSKLNIISYNCTGLGQSNCALIEDLLRDTRADILLLQETWLLKQNLHKLSNIHSDYIGRGISSVKDGVILEGRPYGGLAFLWKKSLPYNVSVIETASSRVIGLSLKNQHGCILILNVYMPVDGRSVTTVSEEYDECLTVIESLVANDGYNMLIIAGDLNTDLSRATAQTAALLDFMMRNSMRSTWTLNSVNHNQHTFVSNNGYKSQIDHFLVSLDCCSRVTKTDTLDYLGGSKDVGHLPVLLEVSCPLLNKQSTNNRTEIPKPNRIAWHEIVSYEDYRIMLDTLIGENIDFTSFECLGCSNYKCRDQKHLTQIDAFCKQLTDVCIQAADLTLPKVKKKRAMPKWNTNIKPLRDDAKFWGGVWKECGRPGSGGVLDIYRQCRRKYHYAIRSAKKREQQMRMDCLAEAMAHSNTRDLWTEVKKIRGHSKVSPPNIDGKVQSVDINKLFADKYNQLYNRVPSDLTSITNRANALIQEDCASDFVIDLQVVDKALKQLKPAKSDGDKGLWSSLIKQASISWKQSLAVLLSTMLTHGHYADELLTSTIVSLPKDPQADICSSDNYRGITLCSSINKVLDWIILLKYSDCFRTSHLQFAYKKQHSTVMCTTLFKEVVDYYLKRKGQVFATLLDASKAFDLVALDKLFDILFDRKLPNSVIRLLLDMYQRQRVRTMWGGEVSECFSSLNGVRQGGVLSPILFTAYIDVLLQRLEASQIGCVVGGEYLGVLGYADDVTLLAPTVHALKAMLKICEDYGREFNLTYNAKKTVCIHFEGKEIRCGTPDVFLNNTKLQWHTTVKHLGSYVSHNLKEGQEIQAKRGAFIGAVNGLLSNFRSARSEVLTEIFNRQCCHFYGCESWSFLDKNICNMYTAWRKGCRKVWKLPNMARSKLLPSLMNSMSPEQQVMSRFAGMVNNMAKGQNVKMARVLAISVNNAQRGLIGQNMAWVSTKWHCGYTFLENNYQEVSDDDTNIRVQAIKELTLCLVGHMNLKDFTPHEIRDLIDFISIY